MELNSLNKRRKQFFTHHLASCFDVLAYTQLIIIYLHDTSFVRFVGGSLLQIFFLSPKEIDVLKMARKQILLVLLIYNITCIAIHSLSRPPTPAIGSYLHGGLTVEFIGTPALTSRLWLVSWSLLLFILQLIQYAFRFPAHKHKTTTVGAETGTASQGVSEEPSEEAAANDIFQGFTEEDDQDDAQNETGESQVRALRNEMLSGHLLVRDIDVYSALVEGWNQEFIVPMLDSMSAGTGLAAGQGPGEQGQAEGQVLGSV